MLNIEDNDMEDLFRKAADKYHLDSGPASDWNKINKALHESMDGKALAIQELNTSDKNKRKYLLLFLFIFLMICGSFIYYFWPNKIENKLTENSLVNHENKEAETSHFKNNQQELTKDDQQKNNISQIQPVIKSFTKNTTSREDWLKNILQRHADFFENKSSSNDSKNNNSLQADVILNESKLLNNQNDLPGNDTSNSQKETTIQPEKNGSLSHLKIEEQKKDSVISKKTSAAKRYSRFYAGIDASPEFTFIKSQKSEPGLTLGVFGGFKINQKWSIETGFFFDKKNYYSKGEYFDKSKIAYLNNLKLISTEGNCTMFEIPLNIRYRFAKNKKNNWSASVGTSSYLMQKEQYDYSFTNYGTNGYGQQSYYHSSNNFFATLNLALGYERQIGKSVSLKIEPYLKTSVKGVGIGRLPMSATGVNAGVSVPFH